MLQYIFNVFLCLQCSDPLGQALLMAFHARSRLLEKSGQNLDNVHEILDYCDKGGALLKESLAFSSDDSSNNLRKVIHEKYMKTICASWIAQSLEYTPLFCAIVGSNVIVDT